MARRKEKFQHLDSPSPQPQVPSYNTISFCMYFLELAYRLYRTMLWKSRNPVKQQSYIWNTPINEGLSTKERRSLLDPTLPLESVLRTQDFSGLVSKFRKWGRHAVTQPCQPAQPLCETSAIGPHWAGCAQSDGTQPLKPLKPHPISSL